MRILVVEDNDVLARALVATLRHERYAVDLATTGAAASELAAVNDYDLVVLDWSIPPPTGIELLRAWRAEGRDVPVLMLTGHADLDHTVDGLDTGADDYLTKPFRDGELLARMRSLLRRRERPLDGPLEAGDLVMDPATGEVTVEGEAVELSAKEAALLEYLLRQRGRVVSRSELSEHVWDETFDPVSNVVDVTVYRLRRKIDGDRTERLLHTVVGRGYVLRPERSA
jgi:two-component system copper resistance phosphate regulon response regulator CusR